MASKLITLRSNPIGSLITAYYSTNFPDEDARLYHPSSMIFSHATSCFHQLQQLLDSEILSAFGRQVPISRWIDELGRLRSWCLSTGVYSKGDFCLDYRLRDSPQLVCRVARQLDWLCCVLRDLQSVPETLQADESGTESKGINLEKKIQEMYLNLWDIISALFEVANTTQKPTPYKLPSANGSKVSPWRDQDRSLGREHYPQAREEITNRLSSAISWRREILISRENNFQKLAIGHAVSDADFASSKAIVKQLEEASSGIHDRESETDESTFLYEAHDEGFSLVQPPSEALDGSVFECSLCFFMVDATNKKSWMQHLALDLMPYICVFGNCDTADRFYERRDEWLNHLYEIHGFESARPVSQVCPLCFKVFRPGYDAGSHLARHLENIAILSIPPHTLENHENLY
jgi:hypothetical protein